MALLYYNYCYNWYDSACAFCCYFKGVVVIDDILHHKSRLQLPTSSKQEKLDSLSQLGKKIPPRHVMLTTKIGNK